MLHGDYLKIKKEDTVFRDSSEVIRTLYNKSLNNNHQIHQFCGSPFSGKRRQGREFARMYLKDGNSYGFQINVKEEMEEKEEGSITKNIIQWILDEMEKHEDFIEDIKKINNKTREFHKFFSKKYERYKFIFVLDDAEIFSINGYQSEFLKMLETWVDKCKNVFLVLTTQFKYNLDGHSHNCICHCEAMNIADAIDLLNEEIQYTYDNTKFKLTKPSDEECKSLVKGAMCWPFLVVICGQELARYEPAELIEVLQQCSLLTFSDEAASTEAQLYPMMTKMFKTLSDRLQETTRYLAPEIRNKFTVKDVQNLPNIEFQSTGQEKQTFLLRLQTRQLLEQTDIKSFKFVDFFKEMVADGALDKFKPFDFENNYFANQILCLVNREMEENIKDNTERRIVRQQANQQLQVLVNHLYNFTAAEQDEAAYKAVIESAVAFLKKTTGLKDDQAFFNAVKVVQEKYQAQSEKTRIPSVDSAFNSDEEEQPDITISSDPQTLCSNISIGLDTDPLHQRSMCPDMTPQKLCNSTGAQSTTDWNDAYTDEVTREYSVQETVANTASFCILPSGCKSFKIDNNNEEC